MASRPASSHDIDIVFVRNKAVTTHEDRNSAESHIQSQHPHWRYIAILMSSTITWFFYHYYIAFYHWNDDIAPSDTWNDQYIALLIVYLVFIWANMGIHPFYFFRKRGEIDINTKQRFWIVSFLVYCVVMTGLCIANYDDYSVRFAQLTVVYVLLPGVIANVIISGYQLQRQPGISIACQCIAWLVSMFIILFVFAGYDDGQSSHLTYYFMVSIIAFCAYLLTSVAIEMTSLLKLRYSEPNAIQPYKVPEGNQGMIVAWIVTVDKVMVVLLLLGSVIFSDNPGYTLITGGSFVVSLIWFIAYRYNIKRRENGMKLLNKSMHDYGATN
eukprot:905818_1